MPLLASIPTLVRGRTRLTDGLAEGWLCARLIDGGAFGLILASAVGFSGVLGAIAVLVGIAWNSTLVILCAFTSPALGVGLGVCVAFRRAVSARPARPLAGARRFPLALLCAGSVLAAVALCLVVPSPMSTPFGWDDSRTDRASRPPLAAGFEIGRLPSGVEVSGPGGTTFVRWPTLHGDDLPDRGWPHVTLHNASGTVWYVGSWSPRGAWAVATFETEGRRLDDGYGDRLVARFGAEGAWGPGHRTRARAGRAGGSVASAPPRRRARFGGARPCLARARGCSEPRRGR